MSGKSGIVLLLLFPLLVARAEVLIDEIMYDPKGSDASAGAEWVEVKNEGAESVDLSKWIFFEADTDHSITPYENIPPVLPAGGYAVISRDPASFKNYFSGFSGALFKASFSLNDGETIAMKNGKTSPSVGSVSYSSEWGGKNDGNSLQMVSGAWKALPPTPGAQNASGTSGGGSGTTTTTPTSFVPSSASASSSAESEEAKIYAYIKGPSVAMAGADAYFSGSAYGLEKEPINNARYLWNFGDGSFKEGQNLMHFFVYPGEYIVFLHASSGKYSATDKTVVKVIPPQIEISDVGYGADSFISVSNKSTYELDVSRWRIEDGGRFFSLPENTLLLPGKTVMLNSDTTGLYPSRGEEVKLLYPNGRVASVFLVGETSALPDGAAQISSKSRPKINGEREPSMSDNAPSLRKETENELLFGEISKTSSGAISAEENLAGASSALSGGEGLVKWILFLAGFLGAAVLLVFSFGKEEGAAKPEAVAGEADADISGLDAEDFRIVDE